MLHRHTHAVDLDDVAPLHRAEGRPNRPGRRPKASLCRVAVHRDAIPELSGSELVHERGGPADVVSVTVRDQQAVDRHEATGAQRRPHDALASVGAPVAGTSTGIDEQRLPARKRHQQGVALPHVPHRQMQGAVAPHTEPGPGGQGHPCPQGNTPRHREATLRARPPRPPPPTAHQQGVIADGDEQPRWRHAPGEPREPFDYPAGVDEDARAGPGRPATCRRQQRQVAPVGQHRERRSRLHHGHGRHGGQVQDETRQRDALEHPRGHRCQHQLDRSRGHDGRACDPSPAAGRR